MKKMKYVCMTAAILTAFSCAAALPVQAASDEETPRISGGAILNHEPYIKVYTVGEEPDLTGAVVSGYGTVSKGMEQYVNWDIFQAPISSQKLDYSEVDITKPGKYPVYLVVEGLYDGAEPLRYKLLELEYVDGETDYTNLGISADRLYFEVGEPLNLDAVKLTTTGRKDGQTWSVHGESLGSHPEFVDASAFDGSKAGDYEITVTAGGMTETITACVMEMIEREKGDWNHDNLINIDDAQNILNVYAQILAGNAPKLNEQQKNAADVNGDGSVDAVDAQLILTYYVQNTVAGIPTDWADLFKPEK